MRTLEGMRIITVFTMIATSTTHRTCSEARQWLVIDAAMHVIDRCHRKPNRLCWCDDNDRKIDEHGIQTTSTKQTSLLLQHYMLMSIVLPDTNAAHKKCLHLGTTTTLNLKLQNPEIRTPASTKTLNPFSLLGTQKKPKFPGTQIQSYSKKS